MKIYDLIVENLILSFFFAWSSCTNCFRFINQNSRWWCFDIISFNIFAAITIVIVCCFVIVFLVAGFIGAWFLWGTDYWDYWFFGFLCCTNNRDDLFLGVQRSCIFDIMSFGNWRSNFASISLHSYGNSTF